jgi:hypothetical protein
MGLIPAVRLQDFSKTEVISKDFKSFLGRFSNPKTTVFLKMLFHFRQGKGTLRRKPV